MFEHCPGSPSPVSRGFYLPSPRHRSLSFPPTPIGTRDNPPDTAHGGHANSHDFSPPRGTGATALVDAG